MTKKITWKEKLLGVFDRKTIWKRVIITLLVLIFGAFLVLSDQQCDYNKKSGQLSCGSKSHVEIKK